MKRIILLLSIVTLAGCANTTPRQSPEEWLNQRSDERIEAVVSSCYQTHLNYVDGKSPVDCKSNNLRHLTMSFPDRALYVENEVGIGEFFSMWCVAVANRTGNMPAIQLEIREEGKLFGVPCRRLLTRMQENEQRVSEAIQ
jgi:hypothetical protein